MGCIIKLELHESVVPYTQFKITIFTPFIHKQIQQYHYYDIEDRSKTVSAASENGMKATLQVTTFHTTYN